MHGSVGRKHSFNHCVALSIKHKDDNKGEICVEQEIYTVNVQTIKQRVCLAGAPPCAFCPCALPFPLRQGFLYVYAQLLPPCGQKVTHTSFTALQ